jgi:hypothetical protein
MRQDIGAATKLAARLQRLISMSLSLSSAASSSSDGLCLPVPGRREQSAQHAGALTSHRLPSHRLPSHSLPSHHLTSHQRSFCVFTQAPACSASRHYLLAFFVYWNFDAIVTGCACTRSRA